MYNKQINHYDIACHQMLQERGIRFAGIINNQGRKISGGFGPNIIPLEKDENKMKMLMMELALDLSMRNEFNDSLGRIWAIVSYRDNANIITIPHENDFLLVSSEPEVDSIDIIRMAYRNLLPNAIMGVMIH